MIYLVIKTDLVGVQLGWSLSIFLMMKIALLGGRINTSLFYLVNNIGIATVDFVHLNTNGAPVQFLVRQLLR